VIASEIRVGDAAYRYGGEEFLAVFAGQALRAAVEAVERIRESVARATALADLPAPATLSARVAEVTSGDGFEAIIGRADLALYEAKGSGRNRVSVCSNA
jgi:diguanylate cyclase (GGDEF)-like protein